MGCNYGADILALNIGRFAGSGVGHMCRNTPTVWPVCASRNAPQVAVTVCILAGSADMPSHLSRRQTFTSRAVVRIGRASLCPFGSREALRLIGVRCVCLGYS